MGCGPLFLNIFNALYVNPVARINLNKCYTDFLSIRRGTRQGCPLSPLLFAIGIEPLAQAITASQDIQGISIGSTLNNVMLFADDMLVTMIDPEKSLPTLNSLLQEFGQISGLKVNSTKTLLYSINISQQIKENLQLLFPFKWVTASMPYLGIQTPLDLKEMVAINFSPLLSKISNDFKRWNSMILIEYRLSR